MRKDAHELRRMETWWTVLVSRTRTVASMTWLVLFYQLIFPPFSSLCFIFHLSVYLSHCLFFSLFNYLSVYLSVYIEILFTPIRIPTPPHSMMTPLAQSPFAFRMIHSRKTSTASSMSVSRKRGRTVIVTGQICRWFLAADAFLAMIGLKIATAHRVFVIDLTSNLKADVVPGIIFWEEVSAGVSDDIFERVAA